MTTRLLVLGGNGMLGVMLSATAKEDPDLSCIVTTRRGEEGNDGTCFKLEVEEGNNKQIKEVIDIAAPDVVVNCIGSIKQKRISAREMIYVNSYFPHALAEVTASYGSRLIHLSTDCVYSGVGGYYNEHDIPDPIDLYGKTKLCGEPMTENTITIRTSIVGHEKSTSYSLIDWFLNEQGPVLGYSNAMYSGLTTRSLSKVICKVAKEEVFGSGVFHVSAERISKYDLLNMVNKIYGCEKEIVEAQEPRIDRTLDSSLFRRLYGWEPEGWKTMVREMKETRSLVGRKDS